MLLMDHSQHLQGESRFYVQTLLSWQLFVGLLSSNGEANQAVHVLTFQSLKNKYSGCFVLSSAASVFCDILVDEQAKIMVSSLQFLFFVFSLVVYVPLLIKFVDYLKKKKKTLLQLKTTQPMNLFLALSSNVDGSSSTATRSGPRRLDRDGEFLFSFVDW